MHFFFLIILPDLIEGNLYVMCKDFFSYPLSAYNFHLIEFFEAKYSL